MVWLPKSDKSPDINIWSHLSSLRKADRIEEGSTDISDTLEETVELFSFSLCSHCKTAELLWPDQTGHLVFICTVGNTSHPTHTSLSQQ